MSNIQLMKNEFEPGVSSKENILQADLQKAQDATFAAEENFSLLVESVKDYAIFMMGTDGTILSWNAGAERIKGYKASEIIGKKFTTFYTQADIDRHHPENELRLALANGKYEEEGWRVRKNGNHFWANVVITPLFDKSNHQHIGFAKVTRDLTEKKLADDLLKMAYADLEKKVEERTKELQQANEQLTEAVHTRDEFLSIASHELRTPLTPLKLQIQNFVHQIRKNNLLNVSEEKLKRMADTCERSVARISTLIDNLLDVSRINAGKLTLNLEPIELKSVCEELLDRFKQETINSGSEVSFHASKAIDGSLDRIRFEQIFLNLLTNSLKYGNKNPVVITLEKEDENAILTFSDKGLGISEQNISRIFERFERVSENKDVSGLGLGLFITRQIVEAHGGTISASSKEHEGSVFTVILPLNQ
jgi:PAS domain S-box-containing protein